MFATGQQRTDQDGGKRVWTLFPKNESEADPSAGTKYEIVLNAEKKKGEMRCSQRMSHVINLELNSTIEA